MNLKNEIDYRLLIIAVNYLFENGKISKQERNKTVEKLIMRFHPPFGKIEYDAYAEESL